ncbi:hypothetical protein B0T14DRAFT_531189 [Immersiella caudata]|uniref:Uncharacterized protein n=1 Tax=Immersiella caudata TaxID=314043 RepID=A0AA39W4K4_9PEZI|nr:hypothetical protein B0T14DRAFT_531189 [Immersiella caudata]
MDKVPSLGQDHAPRHVTPAVLCWNDSERAESRWRQSAIACKVSQLTLPCDCRARSGVSIPAFTKGAGVRCTSWPFGPVAWAFAFSGSRRADRGEPSRPRECGIDSNTQRRVLLVA